MKRRLISVVAAIMLATSLSTVASAAALDNLGGGTPAITQQAPTQGGLTAPTQQNAGTAAEKPSAGDTIGDVYENIGIDKDTMDKASKTVAPVVKWVNYGLGIGVGLLGTFLLAITIIDMIYIVSPPAIRNIGGGGAPQAANPMGGAPAPQQERGFASIISDDCKNSLMECGVAAAPQGGAAGGAMGGAMGSYGGGAMGGYGGAGGYGAQQAAQTPPKAKKVLQCYMKKRITTFILLGICAIVLTCTCFLNVGTTVGQWIVDKVSGVTG